MSGDRLDLLARIQELKEENEKLDYLYHKSLNDYVKQFNELQKYKKALDKACHKLEHYDCMYGDLMQENEWKEWCLNDE